MNVMIIDDTGSHSDVLDVSIKEHSILNVNSAYVIVDINHIIEYVFPLHWQTCLLRVCGRH